MPSEYSAYPEWESTEPNDLKSLINSYVTMNGEPHTAILFLGLAKHSGACQNGPQSTVLSENRISITRAYMN